MSQQHLRFCGCRMALAAATLGVWLTPAWGLVVVSGNANVYPQSIAIGPGDTDLGGNTLGLGGGGVGGLVVDGGSQLSAASIRFADGGNGVATGLVDGVGSRINLTGNGNTNRLELGAWGKGMLTVSGGATLDGRTNSADCLLGARWCHNFIGNAAGSDATLTITGVGSNASLLRAFVVGGLAVFRPPIENFTFGTPGGTTRGTVNVLAGGTLVTDGATLGAAPGGSSPAGTERSFADVTIDGAGSAWRITGGTLDTSGAGVTTAQHRNAVAALTISGGGKLWIDGKAGIYNYINLTNGGGRTDARVTGVGSAIVFSGDAGVLQVGFRLGSASMSIDSGGSASGMFYVSVGRNGSFGDLAVDGAGSLLRVDGTASAQANGSLNNAVLDIGRNGNGLVNVSNGGRIELIATGAATNGAQLNLGRDAASAGTLNITGAGSVVSLSTQSVLASGGPGEAFNPIMRVGRDGNGTLNITGGGKLLIDGRAVSTVADSRSTSLYIGGTGDNTNGGKGIALVSGAGSEIRLSGVDTFIGVGFGPQSFGLLTVAHQADVSAIGMNVGRSGGVGVLAVDNATVHFSGQQAGFVQAGAFLSIGRSGGTGIVNIGNASVITLNNLGSQGASLNLGGTGPGPLGDGSLTLSGASKIHIQAAPGLATLSVARDGSGLMRVKGGSSVDVGDGTTYVGRLKGSDGTLILSEASSLSTGWLGVGRNKTATGSEDGGTGTLLLINSSLTANTIVIGSNGFLGGTGTITGNVTNFGIFAPGNSPGTLEITGAFTAEAGSRMILEVQGDGHGGFATDRVIFGGGQPLDLAHLKVEFRFLGSTNPNDFQAQQLFDVDTFFQLRTAGGGMAHLAAAAFAGATFSAQADAYTVSNFSFSAANGASFTATPVPEPASLAMLLAGLALLGGMAQRARAAQARGRAVER